MWRQARCRLLLMLFLVQMVAAVIWWIHDDYRRQLIQPAVTFTNQIHLPNTEVTAMADDVSNANVRDHSSTCGSIQTEMVGGCFTRDVPKLAPRQYTFLGSTGCPFHISDECWIRYGLPPKKFASLNVGGDILSEFVFVTAASADHYKESVDAIASVQANWPGRKLIYYDLGLKPEQLAELTGSATRRSKYCDVEYRVFNFSNYPPHVGRPNGWLKTASFKILIINEVLQQYDGVFWVDTSVRFTSSKLPNLRSHVINSKGFLLFRNSNTSIWAVTAPEMYDYLPTNVEKLKELSMWEGGSMLIYNTIEVYENILKWAYACALVRDCIAPNKNAICLLPEGESRYTRFANCHRYDQSLVNILLANWWQFDESRYVVPHTSDRLLIERWPSYYYEKKLCPTT